MTRNICRAAIAGIIAIATATHCHALTVFDPFNYEQNLLTATRELESVQTQIRQLESSAQQLLRMDQNLKPLAGSIAGDLQTTLSELTARIQEGQALALNVRATSDAYTKLYPTTFTDTTNSDPLQAAKSRWDEAYASFERAALVQGQIVDSVTSDGTLLTQILGRSQTAVGALQAAQVGNELTALNVKQSLQLQSLLAAQTRAETTDRARSLVAQEEARQNFKSFVGSGSAYTRGQ